MRKDDVLEFVKRRHDLYVRKSQGITPWTEDPTLSKYRFTNVYRELDRNTIWIRDHVRERFWGTSFLVPAVILARLVNRISVLELMFHSPGMVSDPLIEFLTENSTEALEHLVRTSIPKGPYATSAYMMKTPTGMDKLSGLLYIARVATGPDWNCQSIAEMSTLKEAGEYLTRMPYLGGFLAAQIVADLKYTPALANATDWWTWAASGPGSRAGMNVVLGRYPAAPIKEPEWYNATYHLWEFLNEKIPGYDMPPLHMQDVQNVLCEFSKYDRGYSRTLYKPG